jgi:peptide/nickel transport system ATP-binding protein
MAEPLVTLSGLTVDFDTGKRVVRALHGIDLDVGKGEAVGLVGESGCGKSVTWLAALGLLPKSARIGGEVRLNGRNLVGAPVAELERVRGRHIAMIFQDPSSSLNPVHRIGRQLGEALSLHRGLDGAAAAAEARRLLDRVHIADAARRLGDYPHELSGGMNQRVMIAMALAGQPDLLVADEPTTALDATIQAQILELLGEIRRDSGMALVLSADASRRSPPNWRAAIASPAFARPRHARDGASGGLRPGAQVRGPSRHLAVRQGGELVCRRWRVVRTAGRPHARPGG